MRGWQYTFDDGPEKALECKSTLYLQAAMAAFACEDVTQMPEIQVPGLEPYHGHVLTLWDPDLLPDYGPYQYGIGFNQCGGLAITSLGTTQHKEG